MANITDPNELALIGKLTNRLNFLRTRNVAKEAYYEAKTRFKNLNISVPPSLNSINTAVGWGGTVVDTLAERITLNSFTGDQSIIADVKKLFNDNNLDTEINLAILDALIYGTSYMVVGAGNTDAGEPDVLITSASPMNLVSTINPRSKKVDNALQIIYAESDGTNIPQPQYGVLYLPNTTVYFQYVSGTYVETQPRDEHTANEVPVYRLVNRPRSANLEGRSEITPTIRSLVDSTIRTLVGEEITKEFFAAPQRYILGASKDDFLTADGLDANAWSAYIGRYLAISGQDTDASGNPVNPSVGQFPSNSPQPFIDIINQNIDLVSGESGIPVSYLGKTTSNPASAEAIRASEARLVKKAEDRQKGFGIPLQNMMEAALFIKNKQKNDVFNTITPVWRRADLPTQADDAQFALMLVQSEVLQPDSAILYNRLGFTAVEQEQILQENAAAARKKAAAGLAQSLSIVANNIRQQQQPVTPPGEQAAQPPAAPVAAK